MLRKSGSGGLIWLSKLEISSESVVWLKARLLAWSSYEAKLITWSIYPDLVDALNKKKKKKKKELTFVWSDLPSRTTLPNNFKFPGL